jgi:hypothetical protein
MNEPSPDDPTRTRVQPDRPAADTSAAPAAGPGSTLPAETTARVPGPHGLPAVPRYEIVREVGRGGMGVVYEARQVGLNRTVALKMILAGAHAGPEAVRRFRAEAEAVARLKHPNVVQIHDIDEAGGLPFFALEFVPGGTLERRLAAGPLPVAEAVWIAERLAAAVAAAHEAGIVHRDLKPANVLLAEDGTPKVTDFGLAKSLEADDGRTATGAILGTPNYMAPEQAEGRVKDIGPATDIWSLGAVLYAMLTGRPPFRGDSTLQTLDLVRFKEPEAPRRVRAEVPPALEAVCLKCLAKNPADRYLSAAALVEDLARVRDGKPPLAAGRVRRNRWARPAVAALLLVALTVAIVLIGRPRPGDGGTDQPAPPPGTTGPAMTAGKGEEPNRLPQTVDPELTAGGAAADGADRPPGRYALLVGVREYHVPGQSLEFRYTERDVDELARALHDRGFERRNISVLTQWNQADNPDLAPTAANVRKRLRAMAQNARPGDTVVVALTGHGVQAGDPAQFHFWPAGATPSDPGSMISQKELYDAFAKCRAGVKLLVVDACRGFAKGELNLRQPSTQVPPPEAKGFAAFYSCSPGQDSWEADEYRHGVFTYHLLAGLRGAADADKDGLVSLGELVRHTARGVQEAKAVVGRGKKDVPFYQLPELVGDLPRDTPIGGPLAKPEPERGHLLKNTLPPSPPPRDFPPPPPTGGAKEAPKAKAAPNIFGD